MKILAITAGAANMYCGSCLRDNALAAELIASTREKVCCGFIPIRSWCRTYCDSSSAEKGRPPIFIADPGIVRRVSGLRRP